MRKVHFVGSLPGTSAREALAFVKEHAGNYIGPCLSDGETGERSGWMIHIYEAQRRLPELEVAKDGDFSDWEHVPQLRVRKGSQFRKADLSVLSRSCTESLEEFTKVRSELGREDLDFMVGIISPLGLSYQIFGYEPNQWKPHVAAFQAATVEEVREINRITGGYFSDRDSRRNGDATGARPVAVGCKSI